MTTRLALHCLRHPASLLPVAPHLFTGAVVLAALAATPSTASAQTLPTVTGYNGTQTFQTAPGKDPDEPNACGVVGGASYWFSYKPPTNGCISLNTDGSSFDTVLAVFVDDGRNLGYASLLPVVCDNNGGTNGLTSSLKFTGSPATNYYIMLDGVNGACGTARLNYSLNQRPTISSIAAQSITEDASTALLSFAVSDKEYAATNLTLVGISTNQTWVPTNKIVFGGTGSSRTVKVTPGTNQWGTNYITIVVKDPGGASNMVSFLLKVSAVNDAPIAKPDTVVRLPGKAIAISRSFPPRNDTDVDGNTLTVSASATKSTGGVAVALGATFITYSPSTTYNSSDKFTYTLSDGKGKTATGTIYVNVGTNGVTTVYSIPDGFPGYEEDSPRPLVADGPAPLARGRGPGRRES